MWIKPGGSKPTRDSSAQQERTPADGGREGGHNDDHMQLVDGPGRMIDLQIIRVEDQYRQTIDRRPAQEPASGRPEIPEGGRSLVASILAGVPAEQWPRKRGVPTWCWRDHVEKAGIRFHDALKDTADGRTRHLQLSKDDLEFLELNPQMWTGLGKLPISELALPAKMSELPFGLKFFDFLKIIHLPEYHGSQVNVLPLQSGSCGGPLLLLFTGSRHRPEVKVIYSGQRPAVLMRSRRGKQVCDSVFGMERPDQHMFGTGTENLQVDDFSPISFAGVQVEGMFDDILSKGWPEGMEFPLSRKIGDAEQRERVKNLWVLCASKHEPTAIEVLHDLLLARDRMSASELLSLLAPISDKSVRFDSLPQVARSQRWETFEYLLECFYMQPEFVAQLDDLEICLLGRLWLGEHAATYTGKSEVLSLSFRRFSGILRLAGIVKNTQIQVALLNALAKQLGAAKAQSAAAGKCYQGFTKEYIYCLYRDLAPRAYEPIKDLVLDLPQRQPLLNKIDPMAARLVSDLLERNSDLLPYEKNIINTINTGALIFSLIPSHVFLKCSDSIFSTIAGIRKDAPYDSIKLPHYLPEWPKGIEKCTAQQIEAPYFRGDVIDLEKILVNRHPSNVLTISLGEKDAWRDGEPDVKLPEGTSAILAINGKIKIKGGGRRGLFEQDLVAVKPEPVLWPIQEGASPRLARRVRQKLERQPVQQNAWDPETQLSTPERQIERQIEKRQIELWNVVSNTGVRRQAVAFEELFDRKNTASSDAFTMLLAPLHIGGGFGWILNHVVNENLERTLIQHLFSDEFLSGLGGVQLRVMADRICNTQLICVDISTQNELLRDRFVDAMLSGNFLLRLSEPDGVKYLRSVGRNVAMALQKRHIRRLPEIPVNWRPAQLDRIINLKPGLMEGVAALLNDTYWLWEPSTVRRLPMQDTSIFRSDYFVNRTSDLTLKLAAAQFQDLLDAGRSSKAHEGEEKSSLLIDLHRIHPDVVSAISMEGWKKLIALWKGTRTKNLGLKAIHFPSGMGGINARLFSALGGGLEYVRLPGYRGFALAVKSWKPGRRIEDPKLVFDLGFSEKRPHVAIEELVEGATCEYRWLDIRSGIEFSCAGSNAISSPAMIFGSSPLFRCAKVSVTKMKEPPVRSPESTSEDYSFDLEEGALESISAPRSSDPTPNSERGKIRKIYDMACQLMQCHEDVMVPLLWARKQLRTARLKFTDGEFHGLLEIFIRRAKMAAYQGAEVGLLLRLAFRSLAEISEQHRGIRRRCEVVTIALIKKIELESRDGSVKSAKYIFHKGIYEIDAKTATSERRAALFKQLRAVDPGVSGHPEYLKFIRDHLIHYIWYNIPCGDRLENTFPAAINKKEIAPKGEPIYHDRILFLEHLSASEAESILADEERLEKYRDVFHLVLPRNLIEIPGYVKKLKGCRVLMVNDFQGTSISLTDLPIDATGEEALATLNVIYQRPRVKSSRKRGGKISSVTFNSPDDFPLSHHFVRAWTPGHVRFQHLPLKDEARKWTELWISYLEGRPPERMPEQDRAFCEHMLDAEISWPDKIRCLTLSVSFGRSDGILNQACDRGAGNFVKELLKVLLEDRGEIVMSDPLLVSLVFDMFRQGRWLYWYGQDHLFQAIDESFLLMAGFIGTLKTRSEAYDVVERERVLWLEDVRPHMRRNRFMKGYLAWYRQITGISEAGGDQLAMDKLVEEFRSIRLDRMAQGDEIQVLTAYVSRCRIPSNSPLALSIVRALEGNTLDLSDWISEDIKLIDIGMIRAFEEQAKKKKANITRLKLPAGLSEIPACFNMLSNLEYLVAPGFSGNGFDLTLWEKEAPCGSLLTFDICSARTAGKSAKAKEIKFVSQRHVAVLVAQQDNEGNTSFQVVFPFNAAGNLSAQEQGMPPEVSLREKLRHLTISENSLRATQFDARHWVATLYFLLEHIESLKTTLGASDWRHVLDRVAPMLLYLPYPKGVAYLVYQIVQNLYAGNGPAASDIGLQSRIIKRCAHSAFLNSLTGSELAVLLPVLLVSVHDNEHNEKWMADLENPIALLKKKASACGISVERGWRRPRVETIHARRVTEPMALSVTRLSSTMALTSSVYPSQPPDLDSLPPRNPYGLPG